MRTIILHASETLSGRRESNPVFTNPNRTHYLISQGDFSDTLKLAEIYLTDTHDLMHKATGWMLREVGKKDKAVLVKFLEKYKTNMPRTALRYSIEHFSKKERLHFMQT
jgi:3-methyladenine DNA glycosylase AlkD